MILELHLQLAEINSTQVSRVNIQPWLSDDLGIRWTVFSDFGSVWDTDYADGVIKPNDNAMRQTLGVGFLWDTAVGPLTFFWADPISKESHDRTKRFQFNIGTRF